MESKARSFADYYLEHKNKEDGVGEVVLVDKGTC